MDVVRTGPDVVPVTGDEMIEETGVAGEVDSARPIVIRRWRANLGMTALLSILFLTFLDNTVISAVLANVQSELHSGVTQLQWVVGGYALAFASLMLMCGALGDAYGRRRVMVVGVAVFCAGSIICALAPTSAVLIAGRVVMGAGAAASEPGTLSMIRQIYPDARLRARSLGAWAAVSGTGPGARSGARGNADRDLVVARDLLVQRGLRGGGVRHRARCPAREPRPGAHPPGLRGLLPRRLRAGVGHLRDDRRGDARDTCRVGSSRSTRSRSSR